MLLQAPLFPELLAAVRTLFRNNRAVKPEVPGVAFLLEGEAANGAAGHLWGDPEVAQHVAHQGFVVFKVFITDGAHLK